MSARPIGPRVSGLVRRTSWLMLGAAIGLAAVALAVGLAQLLAPLARGSGPPLTVAALLAIPLLGLLPGVRDLEITAARSLLGVEALLLTLDPGRAEYRIRTVGWVAVHLVGGLAVAVLAFAAVPGSVAVVVAALSGTPVDLVGLPLPTDRPELRIGVVVVAVLAVAASILGCWGAGLAARRLAPWFLGPTWRDQWQLAESRLATETTHTRLARELHDGIGHALTIISVQATAARRASGPAADHGLQVIEQTAREALEDLDSVLSVLRRDEPAARSPEPDLEAVAALLDRHRAAGMQLQADIPAAVTTGARLPGPVSRLGYRVLAEALTNVERYGDGGLVAVTIRGGDELSVRVTNSVRPHEQPADRRGHGLNDLTEQLRMVGGRLDAGPGPAGSWELAVAIPLGRRRG